MHACILSVSVSAFASLFVYGVNTYHVIPVCGWYMISKVLMCCMQGGNVTPISLTFSLLGNTVMFYLRDWKMVSNVLQYSPS